MNRTTCYMKGSYLGFLTTGLLSVSCVLFAQQHPGPLAEAGHGDANAHMNQAPFEDLAASFESAERESWQKPDEVVAALGDISGMTIMDIGSGTGYFSFRLVEAGARVICADVDDRFLNHIRQRKEAEGLTDEQMEIRKVPYDSSSLEVAEVDMAIIVDTYHHIQSRTEYFAEVRRGLKPGGRLVVVDFFKIEVPVGPPVEMKLSADTIVDELRSAGFQNFEINQELLPYQYIIFAS